MRRVGRFLLWVFVFTQPWDAVTLPGIGALSRVVGLATFGAAVLTIGIEGRFRRPDAMFWCAAAFVASNALSLIWTISYGATYARTWTYAQLLGSVWLVQEFARTREQQQSLLAAFCLGAFVPMANLLNNFRLGVQISAFNERFSSSGALRLNADNLGLTLVIAIPMAWYLVQHRRGIVRIVAAIYFALAPVAILLTGTRGAFLAGIVALSIAPLTMVRQSLRSAFAGAVLLAVLTAMTALVVPQSIWARISTIQTELLEDGTMTGRADIWTAGVRVFPDHALLGVGAGAFGTAVEPLLGTRQAAHNMPLAVLVEQGVVGFFVFVALLGGCALTIWRIPSPDRKLWAPLMLSWLVGVMSVNFEESKVTWLLFGLLAAQAAATSTRRHLSDPERERAETATRPGVLRPAHRSKAMEPLMEREFSCRQG